MRIDKAERRERARAKSRRPVHGRSLRHIVNAIEKRGAAARGRTK